MASSLSVHTPDKRQVAYYYDDDVSGIAFNLIHPMKPHRIAMAHSLIVNYGMDRKMDMLTPPRASDDEMTRFHSDEYIDLLRRVTPDNENELTSGNSKFLVGEDCPYFEGLYEFCTISAGASMAAAQRITSGQADIAINWAGGLHHAKRREASGFCYVNDIVLGILELLRHHQRVLYIDIDVHHGDGVEEAFFTTDRVMTCSFHRFGDFFPGSGHIMDRGIGRGKGYAVNVPFRDGIEDTTYYSVFQPVIQAIMEWYRPGAVVLQCGADSLAEDRLGAFNLSMRGHGRCAEYLRTFNVPFMMVGGGGYTIRNVARTWAYETGIALGEQLDPNLPLDDYTEYYGPEFKLDVPNNNMENLNDPEYLHNTLTTVLEGLKNLPFAPSVQVQTVPGDAILNEQSDSDYDSDTDVRIKEKVIQFKHKCDDADEAWGEDDTDYYFKKRKNKARYSLVQRIVELEKGSPNHISEDSSTSKDNEEESEKLSEADKELAQPQHRSFFSPAYRKKMIAASLAHAALNEADASQNEARSNLAAVFKSKLDAAGTSTTDSQYERVQA